MVPDGLRIELRTSADQEALLQALQRCFVDACNEVSQTVQQTHCWNRVALHHLVYRDLRNRFPTLGSQMACNVVYSVSRAARLVYQSPSSPFFIGSRPGQTLPRIVFLPDAPVFFDRHTLSLRDCLASLYTLDGRMRFHLPLAPHDAQHFRTRRLRETLLERHEGRFALRFVFADAAAVELEAGTAPVGASPRVRLVADDGRADPPSYLTVTPTP